VLLAVIALTPIAVAVGKATGSDLLKRNEGLAIGFVGTVASSIALTFVLEGDQRRLGLYLSFAAALGILYGGWRIMHEAPGTPGPLGDVLSGIGSKRAGSNGASESSAATTPMPATETPGVPGGGASGVSPGKEGPGAPHPGTSTGGPGDGDTEPRPPAADAIPGQTGAQTPPGLVGDPPAGEGTHPPGL
jgi:hypothetical protein